MAVFIRNLSLVLIFQFVYHLLAEEVEVDLGEQGVLVGIKERYVYPLEPYKQDMDMYVFKGVPFAEIPVGNLRFAKPQPKLPWGGVWNSTYYRPMCPQVSLELDRFGVPPQNEDCLHLNIWSPDIDKTEGYPVMFWIHGGGFTLGSALNRPYEGDALSAFNDVVVVSTNYRLNGYGFIATGDAVLPGNYGLWDQQLALKWVHDHIAQFGGDPSKITIFGQSAGGASVGYQLTSPYSWPYFNNAILMSGTMTSPWAYSSNTNRYREKAFALGETVGCVNMMDSVQLVNCLRNVSEEDLRLAFLGNSFGPLVDNDFIPGDPLILLQEGRFKKCPIMLGTTKDEGDLFGAFRFAEQSLSEDPYCSRLRFNRIVNEYSNRYGSDYVGKAIQQEYIDWSHADNESANYFRNYIDLETDVNFLCPTDETARFYTLAGLDVFRWMFSYIPDYSIYPPIPKWKGSAHGDDMELIFGNGFQDQYYNRRNYSDYELKLALDMQRYYTNFAKTGDPNQGGDNDGEADEESYWDKFTIPELKYKELTVGLPDKRAYGASVCHLWNQLIPRIVTSTADIMDVYEDWRQEYTHWKQHDMMTWSMEFQSYMINMTSSCNP
ncbi:putative acetylcholinesterase [Apostichopus japonicus]|uniref:Carboxylic ester hydrolase n=1 Tax=Stichopus japonicus TaxID=307972 RepID=A0A2G8KPS0_STIJA|nr:putative acetylcholinesterase [Apostichopus japonicus]